VIPKSQPPNQKTAEKIKPKPPHPLPKTASNTKLQKNVPSLSLAFDYSKARYLATFY
jgi:hypothetical protein